ncbi:TetR/AcrR family transcriptional regulator [Streptomyces physcomitrii]|nr:TetR/AcrR family transcriptional regulator [Streptomyces physcomitrii]
MSEGSPRGGSSSEETPGASGAAPEGPARKPRTRMAPKERRRQLVGIGLRKLVERPIHELSIDEVAQEAGISRGLLFHHFPNKTAFHDEVVAAAGRRVMRNTAPDEGLAPEPALEQFVRRYLAQIARRRDFYLALVFGRGAVALGGERVESLRTAIAQRTLGILGLDESALPVAHAWAAYAEDRALQWSGRPAGERARTEDEEVTHCVRALGALLGLEQSGPTD